MLLLKIVYEGEELVISELQELKRYFKSKDITLGISESINNNTHFIKILCEDKEYNEKLKSSVNLYISNILYGIVIDIFKRKEMYEFLTDTYFFLRSDEIPLVSEKINEALIGSEPIKDDTSIYCINRKNNIINKIKQCIDENNEVNIDGFIRFRMKELLDDLQSIVDKVVEKYLVEKEYNEFVKLLKYFVDVQDSKIEELNITIDKNGNYILSDNLGKDILNEFMNELIDCKMGIESVNVEDVIISGLITNAPRKINIYGSDNCINKEILETIKNVFGERVVFNEKNREILDKPNVLKEKSKDKIKI